MGVDLGRHARCGYPPRLMVRSKTRRPTSPKWSPAWTSSASTSRPREHVDDFPALNWALLTQAAYEQQITTTLDRASAIRVKHLLSHTSGLRNSGNGAKEAAAEHFGKSEDDVTAAEYHQAVLMGKIGVYFLHDPGTEWDYSNHGYSVAGLLIEEASDEGSYRSYIEDHLLGPLGLFDVVPNNASISDLDVLRTTRTTRRWTATPTSSAGWACRRAAGRHRPETGGRIMCSIDQSSTGTPLARPARTVEVMASDAAPAAQGSNPIGWDSRSGFELSKNGDIPTGGRRGS